MVSWRNLEELERERAKYFLSRGTWEAKEDFASSPLWFSLNRQVVLHPPSPSIPGPPEGLRCRGTCCLQQLKRESWLKPYRRASETECCHHSLHWLVYNGKRSKEMCWPLLLFFSGNHTYTYRILYPALEFTEYYSMCFYLCFRMTTKDEIGVHISPNSQSSWNSSLSGLPRITLLLVWCVKIETGVFCCQVIWSNVVGQYNFCISIVVVIWNLVQVFFY